MTDHLFRQSALGAVLGSAAGDALGAPFEFGPAGQYSARFREPVVSDTGEMVGGGGFGWARGSENQRAAGPGSGAVAGLGSNLR